MICKNEISNIENLLNIVCPILEQVVVVDTGSSDGTKEKLLELSQKYSNLEIKEFEWIKDFSAARNHAFSFATQEFIMFLDCDDLVDAKELINFKDNFLKDDSVDCWILDYIYSRYPNGDPQTILGRERFVRRECSPRWVGAIHETISIWNMRQRYYGALKVIHNQTGKVVDYNRNVDILASEFEKNPRDPRTAYYYGKELFDRVNPKGIEVLKHFVALPSKYWDDEINGRFRLACDDLVNNRLTEALHHAESIYHLDSSRLRAEGYWVYGQVEQKLKNFKVAIKWYERCLDGEPGSPRVLNREYYTWNPMYRLSECYREMGLLDESVYWYNRVCGILPNTNSMVSALENSLINKFFAGRSLKVIEQVSHTPIRSDSVLSTCMFGNSKFAEGKLDGLVVDNSCNVKLVKPGGFVWSRTELLDQIGLGLIGKAVYNGVELFNYVVSNPALPKFILSTGDINFGPYRIRIDQLRKSLIKNGYPIVQRDGDYLITQNLNASSGNAKIKILDVCEWLPDSNYSGYGIDKADIVVCSSPMLSELLSKKFPDKNVMCVEDHVDFVEQEWL